VSGGWVVGGGGVVGDGGGGLVFVGVFVVGRGVLVGTGVDVRVRVAVRGGIGVWVLVGVGGGESSWVRVMIGVKEIHAEGTGEFVAVKVAVEVWVIVKVKLGRTLTSVLVDVGDDVWVKKSRANAPCVRARSIGVGVGENLGAMTISSCVSILPPDIKTGK
jgi:hypothetical protein